MAEQETELLMKNLELKSDVENLQRNLQEEKQIQIETREENEKLKAKMVISETVLENRSKEFECLQKSLNAKIDSNKQILENEVLLR